MFSLLFLFSFLSSSWANPSELTFALQRYNALAGRKILVVASGPQAFELAQKCSKIDPFLNFFVHPAPEYADIKREIKKARTTYGAKCALHLSIKNRQWSLSPHGACHDPTRTLSIKEDGETWTLIDNKNREVRAIDYAVLTKDEDLLRVLKTEEKKTYDLGKRITFGSALIAGSAVIPLIFGKSEEIAQLEDRRWSAVFLLASSGMMYEAAKIPPKLKQGKNISNYRPKSMVVERINTTWPPPEPVETPEADKETDLKEEPTKKEESEDKKAEPTDDTSLDSQTSPQDVHEKNQTETANDTSTEGSTQESDGPPTKEETKPDEDQTPSQEQP